MKAQTRFQLPTKRTVKARTVPMGASDPRNKLDCLATGGSITSTIAWT